MSLTMMLPLPVSANALRAGTLTSTLIGLLALRLPGVFPMTSAPDFTSVHHAKINVMYGDRSVRSVDKSAYEPLQAQIEKLSTSGAPLTPYIDENNPGADAIWNNFDRQ